MKQDFKRLPGSKIDLTVTLDTKEFLEYYQSAYDRALGKVYLKGFRPGTAPRELADQAIDREKVFHEAAEHAVRDTLGDTKEEHHWIAIDAPKIEVLDASKNKDVGLQYRAEFTVFPEVRLNNYRAVAKKVLGERKPVAVSEKEIEKSLTWLQKSRAKSVRMEREAKKGDLVEADVEGSVEGKKIPDATLKRDRFVIAESNFMPGFDDKLIGHRAGDTFTFWVTAPADYWQRELQGKTISFNVTLHGVFEQTLPALDDAFAQGIGSRFTTLETLKKSIREGIGEEREGKETERIHLKVIIEIGKKADIDIPHIMIERTLDMVTANMAAMLRGGVSDNPKIREELRTRARENVVYHLVLQAIAKAEHLEPTEEEVRAEIKEKNLDATKYYDYSYSTLQSKKVFAFLEKE